MNGTAPFATRASTPRTWSPTARPLEDLAAPVTRGVLLVTDCYHLRLARGAATTIRLPLDGPAGVTTRTWKVPPMADSAKNAMYPLWLCNNCPTLSSGPTCACCKSETYLYPYCLACNERNESCTCTGYDLEAPSPCCGEAYHSCTCKITDHPGHCADCGNLPDGCNCV